MHYRDASLQLVIVCGWILCLGILICSCAPKSNPTQKAQGSESKIDSSIFLKYTTGVRSILEDSKGNIWFGSHNEGVCRFDGNSLKYFTVEDGLSNNQVRSIYEDSNGLVWFECGQGLSHYDGQKITTPTERNYQSRNDWQMGENDLWFKNDEMSGYNEREGHPGVYRYDGATLNFHEFPVVHEPGDEFYYSVSTPVIKGETGYIWFGTYGAVIGFNNTLFFTILDDAHLGLNDTTGHLHVRSILEDSKGRLWIGNNGIGVVKYEGNQTINFSQQQGLISSGSLLTGGFRSPAGSLEHVFSIGEDRHGNIWFGDRDTGAWKYDGKTMKNYNTAHGLTTTHIWHIYNTRDGELWFALGDGSVCRFNGVEFERIF